jgi:hypothetical protein
MIASLRLFSVNRTDSRLDRANRVAPVANHTLAAVRKDEIGVRAQKRLEFRFHRLGDQPPRPRAQDFGERIIDRPFLSKGDNSILVHGVTLHLGGSGGLITNPVTPLFSDWLATREFLGFRPENFTFGRSKDWGTFAANRPGTKRRLSLFRSS